MFVNRFALFVMIAVSVPKPKNEIKDVAVVNALAEINKTEEIIDAKALKIDLMQHIQSVVNIYPAHTSSITFDKIAAVKARIEPKIKLTCNKFDKLVSQTHNALSPYKKAQIDCWDLSIRMTSYMFALKNYNEQIITDEVNRIYELASHYPKYFGVNGDN